MRSLQEHNRLGNAKRRPYKTSILALYDYGNVGPRRCFDDTEILIVCRGLHLELDLPVTTIIRLEDRVGLPSFDGSYCEQDYRGNQVSHFEKHYASQLALRRLCATLHNDINACRYIILFVRQTFDFNALKFCTSCFTYLRDHIWQPFCFYILILTASRRLFSSICS